MTNEEWAKKINYRLVKECCGNCRHYVDGEGDWYNECHNEKTFVDDSPGLFHPFADGICDFFEPNCDDFEPNYDDNEADDDEFDDDDDIEII